jgi:hypothetical protein
VEAMNRAQRREWRRDYRKAFGVKAPKNKTAEEVIEWQRENLGPVTDGVDLLTWCPPYPEYLTGDDDE